LTGDAAVTITPTFVRKLWTTNVGDLVHARAKKLMAQVQYHASKTAGHYYNLRPARQDAMAAKEIVMLIYDGVVKYPTTEDIQEWRNVNCEWMQDVMNEFRNSFF